jgi:hypothetical protein
MTRDRGFESAIAGVRCLIDGAPICCIAAHAGWVKLRRWWHRTRIKAVDDAQARASNEPEFVEEPPHGPSSLGGN